MRFLSRLVNWVALIVIIWTIAATLVIFAVPAIALWFAAMAIREEV